MQGPNILHMNGGEGEYSYNKNSLFQKKVILTAKPMLEESIAELCKKNLSDSCLRMVDMGCSSGPNTLLPLWEIIETIDSTCTSLKNKPPLLQYFLNDLPGNDFNTIFRSSVPRFYQKLENDKGSKKFGDCFIATVPGNFYEKLFPPNFLHFVHSSCSLHWSSQVPEGLVNETGIPLNKGNICLAESSPACVHKAYQNQFEQDFTKFLRSRSVEMVNGGHMVITFITQNDKNPYPIHLQLLGDSLKEMVNEGVIQESILDRFNIAFNAPYVEQVRNVIERESSFSIKDIKELDLRWDANIEDGNNELVFDKWERGKLLANFMRAMAEPLVASHFGDAIIDDLFHKYFFKMVDCLDKGIGMFCYVVISMIKK